MDTYRIPLVWQMYGHCDIDANSLEDAIEIALGADTPLPDGFYVDDSAAVDYEALGLDMKRYREATGDDADGPTAPSSTGGDYSPVSPWDAPGMSVFDFI